MTFTAGDASVVVDAEHGGRLSSLTVAGRELLVQADDVDGEPTLWGLYPMVPWAGRVRDGRFTFEGEAFDLPLDAPPHALHGVGYRAAWDEVGAGHLRLALDWPFGGWAEQTVSLDDGSLTLTMTVGNDERSMPAVAGWHPCFRAGAGLTLPATSMWVRDPSGIPTGERVPAPPGPWDDAFEVEGDPVLTWPELTLTMRSTCPTWVVYDEDPRLVCVEPQTDAPDAFNRSPTVVGPGTPLLLDLRLAWRT